MCFFFEPCWTHRQLRGSKGLLHFVQHFSCGRCLEPGWDLGTLGQPWKSEDGSEWSSTLLQTRAVPQKFWAGLGRFHGLLGTILCGSCWHHHTVWEGCIKMHQVSFFSDTVSAFYPQPWPSFLRLLRSSLPQETSTSSKLVVSTCSFCFMHWWLRNHLFQLQVGRQPQVLGQISLIFNHMEAEMG